VETCVEVDGSKLFYGSLSGNPISRSFSDFGRGLTTAWLLYGTVSEKNQREVEKQITVFGADFSVVHARFLEGSCILRHQDLILATDICEFHPEYVAAMLKNLGHKLHKLVVYSDRQEPERVRKVITHMNGTMSKNSAPLLDVLLMVHSKHFLGNAASTFSENAMDICYAIFENDTHDVLV